MEILSALVKTKTAEELLSKISSEMINRGYVIEEYRDELLKREHSYPTGLAFNGNFHVAIPHANIELTIKEVLIVAKTKEEFIKFRRMDNPTEWIPVDTVFLFAIKDSKRYIQFLSDFLGVLEKRKYQKIIKQLSPKKIVQALIYALPQYDFMYKGFLL